MHLRALIECAHRFLPPISDTYCNESWRICLRARTYMADAINPTTSTKPSAQAAAPNSA